MSDIVIGAVRTYVPNVVGALAALLTYLGVSMSADARVGTAAVVWFLAQAIWYGVVRLLEKRWPWTGALLGVPKAPVYDAKAPAK